MISLKTLRLETLTLGVAVVSELSPNLPGILLLLLLIKFLQILLKTSVNLNFCPKICRWSDVGEVIISLTEAIVRRSIHRFFISFLDRNQSDD